MEDAERFEHAGLTVRIVQDTEPESPREWSNLGTMVCFHRRYNLGDKHKFTVEEAQKVARSIEAEGGIVLPLYLYDHSGITMKTSPFSCPWDSGQVGVIWITANKIREEYSVKRISKNLRDRVTEYLVNEVQTYDDYLTGNVYGFIVEDAEGNNLDSCWAFIGDTKYVIEKAKSAAEHAAKQIQLDKIQAAVKRQQQEATYTYSDWQYDVSNGDTKLGYSDWVDHNVESHKNDKEEACE